MRKKILSGMLMVAAMLFATSVFTSCKDSYTDDINQVKGDLQTEITNLKNELQKQINALKDAQDACKTNCAAVQKDLQDQIDALEAALAGVKECDCDKSLVETLKNGVQALNDEVAALKAQDVILGDKIQILETKLDNIDLSQVEQNKADIATLFTTVSDLTTLVNDAKAAADAANTLAQTAKADAAAAQAAANEAKTAAANAQTVADAAKAAADAANTLAQTAKADAAATQAAANEAKTAAANAQTAADAAKTAADAAKAAADAAKTAADEAQAQADENATKIATVDSALTGLTTKVNSLETKINDLTSDVAKAQAQADAALALAKEDSTRIDALQTALSNIPSYNGYTKEEVDAMINENKMAIEDAAKVADDAYKLAKKAYDLADDAKTIALQALNNAAINAQDIKDINDYLDYIIPALQAEDQNLQNQIDDINNVKLPALVDDIAALQTRMGIVEQAIVDLQKELAKDVDALKKQITGIIVQGTYNPVFGQFSLPVGANSTMLCALYGNYIPSEIPSEYIDRGAPHWPLDAPDLKDPTLFSKVANPTTLDFERSEPLVSDPNGELAYAGKLYLTVNPAEANFTGVDFTLETSAGNQSVFNFSTLKKSTDELTFGWTRAGVPNFYESEAYVNVADLEDAKITKNVNIDEIKTVAKDILNRLRGKGNADIAGAINTLCNNFSGVLPAYAAKVSVDDPTLGTTTVVSNYNIAATAWHPFSYNFLRNYDMPQLPTISPFDVEFKMDTINAEVPSVNADLYLVQDNDGMTYGFFATYEEAYDFMTTFKSKYPEKEYKIVKFDQLTIRIRESLEAVVEKDIQRLQNEIARQAKENVDKIQDQLNSQFINRINNVINKINNKIQNPNQYLQPTVLYQSKKHGWITASTVKAIPTPVKAGSTIELNATSYTNEIFAPAFKKFVAVTNGPSQEAMDAANDHENGFAQVVDGNWKTFAFNATEKGVYEISFAALDYSGNTVVTKHYFEVY